MVRASRGGVTSELKLRPPENREATCKTSARMGGAVTTKRDSSARKQRGPQNDAKTGHLDARDRTKGNGVRAQTGLSVPLNHTNHDEDCLQLAEGIRGRDGARG